MDMHQVFVTFLELWLLERLKMLVRNDASASDCMGDDSDCQSNSDQMDRSTHGSIGPMIASRVGLTVHGWVIAWVSGSDDGPMGLWMGRMMGPLGLWMGQCMGQWVQWIPTCIPCNSPCNSRCSSPYNSPYNSPSSSLCKVSRRSSLSGLLCAV